MAVMRVWDTGTSAWIDVSPGSVGATGATGPMGSTGPTGATGSTGTAGPTGPLVLTVPGALTAAVGTLRFYFAATRTISNVTACVSTAPTGAAILVDVNKNGTTMFTTQGNRPNVAVSTFTDLASAPDVTGVVSGDYITVDVDQIGSTIAGSDLVIAIYYS